MANEIVLDDPALIGSTLYATLRQGVEKYSASAGDYAPVDPDGADDRAIPLTDPDDVGMFRANLPAGLSLTEPHVVKVLKQLGDDPADTDPQVGTGTIGGPVGDGDVIVGGGGDVEVENGVLLSEVMAYIFAAIAGTVDGAGTGQIVMRAGGEGASGPVRIVAQTDKRGNRTNVQLFPRET